MTQNKRQSLYCPACGKGRIADVPNGISRAQYRLFRPEQVNGPLLYAKCPKCGAQVGIAFTRSSNSAPDTST